MSGRVVLLSTGVVDATQGGSGIFNETIWRELRRRNYEVEVVLRTSAAFRGRVEKDAATHAHVQYVLEEEQATRHDFGVALLEKLHGYHVSQRALAELDWEGVTACVSLDLGWALALAEYATPSVCVLGDPYHRRVLATTRFSARDRSTWLALLRAESTRRALRRLAPRFARFGEGGTGVLTSFAPQHAAELRAAGIPCRHSRWFAPGPERPARQPPADQLRLLHVGDLASSASRSMLRGWNDDLLPLLDQLPFPVQIDVVGREPDDAARMATRRQNVVVTFHGHVDDLTDLFSRATAYIAPMSYPVGVRTRILTAIGHGIPVVADSSTAAGLPELQDGTEIVYADSAQTMTAALVALHNDPARAEAMGRAARSAWERLFDPAQNAPALLDLLPELRST